MQLLKLPALFLSIALAACGSSSRTTEPTTAPAKVAQTSNDPSCPVAVAGTSVTVEDAANGAALVFVTTGDVAEVRKRAAALASMHNDHHGKMGALPDGSSAGGEHAGHDMSSHAGHDMSGGEHAGHAGGMIGVHSKASASDIDGGAKVSFVANGGDVAKLQSELRTHAQHLASGSCAMGSS
jgi:hypothetical protein